MIASGLDYERKSILRLHSFAKFMIAFLILAFISGMIINLFIAFPDIPNGIVQSGQYYPLFMEYKTLLFHYVLGILLLIGAIVGLTMSYKTNQTKIIIFNAVGFLSILVAVVAGLVFMHYAFSTVMDSFIMSLGFLVALITYLAIFYETEIDSDIK
jgi:uncharacterized membrane protein